MRGMGFRGGAAGGGSVTLAALRDALVFDPAALEASSGWTLTPPAGGTTTRSGGSLVIAVPNGSGPATSDNRYTPTWPDGTTKFAVQGRFTLASVDTQAGIFVRAYLAWDAAFPVGPLCYFEARANGDCIFSIAGGPTPTFTVPFDGTAWWRMEVIGAKVRCYTGIGSGDTPPTTWTYRGELTLFGPIGYPAAPPRVYLNGGYEGGGGGVLTSSVTVTHRDLALSISP